MLRIRFVLLPPKDTESGDRCFLNKPSEPHDSQLLKQLKIAFISRGLHSFRALLTVASEANQLPEQVSKRLDSWLLIGPNHGHGGSLKQESTSIKGPAKAHPRQQNSHHERVMPSELHRCCSIANKPV